MLEIQGRTKALREDVDEESGDGRVGLGEGGHYDVDIYDGKI